MTGLKHSARSPVVGAERIRHGSLLDRRSTATARPGHRGQHRPRLGPRGAGLRADGAEGNYGVKATADRLLPPAPPGRRPRGEARRPGALAGRSRRHSSVPGCATWRARPHAAQLSGPARRLPGRRRAGRLLAGRARSPGGARRSRGPRPARSGSSPLGRLRPWRRAARAHRRRARTRAGRRGAAGLARARASRARPGASRPARSRPSARWARRVCDLGPRAPRTSATSPTWRCCCSRRTSSTCSTCGRAGSRRSSSRSCSRLCIGAWTRCAARPAGDLHRPGAGGRGVHAAGARDARRHRLQPGRGARRDLAAGQSRGRRRGCVALGIVAALNVYGEFRSISRTIEGVPLLRSLDSLGRVD